MDYFYNNYYFPNTPPPILAVKDVPSALQDQEPPSYHHLRLNRTSPQRQTEAGLSDFRGSLPLPATSFLPTIAGFTSTKKTLQVFLPGFVPRYSPAHLITTCANMQMVVGPPLHSMYGFVVVSEDPTSLGPERVEDGHMRNLGGRGPSAHEVLEPLPWHGVFCTSGSHCCHVLDGLADGCIFWVTNEGPRLFSLVVSCRRVFRKVVLGKGPV